ncbi:hypothetical protein [Paenibacillus sp. 32352]|uniref:hypothetical protein n=1 Tax=Paenibacillus sp. 32352 TaxID=1969111 RepID=UPI0009AE6295|nr:hypothetical protein [Paenibacillus sp. 32352]
MGKVQTLVSTDISRWTKEIEQIQRKANSIGITNLERVVLQRKVSSYLEIIGFFFVLMSNASPRQHKLLKICLEGRRCTEKDLAGTGIESVRNLYAASVAVVSKLSKTVLNREMVDYLLEANSIEEIEEIENWFTENVRENDKLLLDLIT